MAYRAAAVRDARPVRVELSLNGIEPLHNEWKPRGMAPGETPAAIREKIAADVTEVLRQADVRERLAALGLITDGMSPAQFFAFLEGERSKLGVFVERNRAQLQ